MHGSPLINVHLSLQFQIAMRSNFYRGILLASGCEVEEILRAWRMFKVYANRHFFNVLTHPDQRDTYTNLNHLLKIFLSLPQAQQCVNGVSVQ